MENAQTFLKNIDKGFHKEAREYVSPDGFKVSSTRFFAEKAAEAGIGCDDQKELDLFTAKWTQFFNGRWKQYCPCVPPSMEWSEKVRQYAADRWILEKTFAMSEVTMSGPFASTVGKGFATSATQVLFPIFFDTAIVAGILATPVLDRLIAGTIPVNSHTADHLEITGVAGDETAGEIMEGSPVPKMIVKYDDRRVYLKKFGYGLNVTYEAARLQRLPLLERILQRFGQRLANLITDFAIETLVAGDGDSAAASTTAFATDVYTSLVALEMAFPQGYTPDLIVAPKETIQDLLLAVQFQDPLAGVLHQTTGNMPKPVGMDLVRWDAGRAANSWATTMIMMLDPSLAMVQYTEGGLTLEGENIIDGQWQKTVATLWTGFGIMDGAARRVGTGW